MIRNPNLFAIFLTLFGLPFCGAIAEDEAPEQSGPTVHYLELKPGIIANYGSENGKP